MEGLLLIGYSGHAYVVMDALRSAGRPVSGYFDRTEKATNPYSLSYFGSETSAGARQYLESGYFFVAIGANAIRRNVTDGLLHTGYAAAEAAIHATAVVSPLATIGRGTLVGPLAAVNALATVGQGAIVNTSATVEHECRVGNYAHVAPGAVLTGNVTVGEGAFIGANATILPGVRVGAGALIGAGAVVLRDVPPGITVVGNPAKPLT